VIDDFQNPFQILHDRVVPKANDAIPTLSDLPCAIGICRALKRVLAAIEFDRQLRGRAGKIDDVAADWVLPAKPIWQPKLAQRPPQASFRIGHVTPQPARQYGTPSQRHLWS
jgi:hypothetical protein